MNEYCRQNSELLESMINRTFLNSWKEDRKSRGSYHNLELNITADCNLGCSYCYIHRYSEKLYPKNIRNHENILTNTSILIDWLIDNNYTPTLDFFSGAPLEQDITIKCLELIYEKYKEVPLKNRPFEIIVPANFTFLLNDELTCKIEDLIQRFKDIDMHLLLSASVEGKYMEQNRPFKFNQDEGLGLFLPDKDKRNDDYYDKVFEFCKKYNFGFHPMIYSKDIHLWQKNFLWFQDMFNKYEMKYSKLYLLEVRNEEWSDKSLRDYEIFLEWLIRWSWEVPCKKNIDKFMDLMFKERGYNILISGLYSRTRGTTCSLQNTLYIRLGDLALIPCHRMSYDGYNYGSFEVKNNKIIGIKADNVEFAIAIFSNHTKSQSYCVDCLIKDICSAGCLGAQVESTGEPFAPIPTICELYHRKITTILKTFKDIGVYNRFYSLVKSDSLRDIYDNIIEIGGIK